MTFTIQVLQMTRHTSDNTHLSQADTALQIESLVQAIERTESPAFHISRNRSGHQRIEPTQLSRYLSHIRQMLDLVMDGDDYSFSEHLQVFKDACHDIRLERRSNEPVCPNGQGTAYLDHHSSMNLLVERIRQLTGQQSYRRKHRDRRELAKRQERDVIQYTDAVLARYSRTMIVRLNLYYWADIQQGLGVEDVFDDLDALITKHRRHSLFVNLIGHIYCVEQGERNDGQGFHIHAAYFFNGNLECRDRRKAKEISALWKDITQGRGYAHSCNHDREHYGECYGIGQTQRADSTIRPHTHRAMTYLVKPTQHLRIKPMGARSLRKGLVGGLRAAL